MEKKTPERLIEEIGAEHFETLLQSLPSEMLENALQKRKANKDAEKQSESITQYIESKKNTGQAGMLVGKKL